ncbi:PREDICTED: secreted frizzled-related protein 5 [Galeopterus variegatus]|uniref:Secreted frizzled-related protein 5 n=1 Tax=Galeopterus variegatus TaxID=482537 RepID=A0ABM0RUW0_GALVR|nr:PREDICTED: secreted frizzled-related protein 5 [Galeopterus variegatus]
MITFIPQGCGVPGGGLWVTSVCASPAASTVRGTELSEAYGLKGEACLLDQEGVGSQEPPSREKGNRGVREEKTERRWKGRQASSWLPLLAKRCHSDTQVFLCSLFAPVCLDRPIYPCRSLCEAVRAGCAPLMEAYGFPWPEMLHCHKFPLDNDLCIAVQFGHLPATAPPVTKICAQCEMEHSADGLMEQMCSSDFVVKMRIKEIKIENGDRKLIGAQKKKKLLKPGPLKRKDTKRLVLHMKNGAGCPCPQLDSLAGSFLVMGRKVDGQLLLMAVYRWDKKNKEMKFAVKFMFSYPCSLYYPFFYGAAEPH